MRKLKSVKKAVILVATALLFLGCGARTVKYYDSVTEDCDRTLYEYVDIRKIKRI